MTHHRARRGLALVAAVATLGGGALTRVATAASATPDPRESQRLLGLDLITLLLAVTTGTVATVRGLIDDPTPEELADTLQAADPAQLTKLLAAARLNGQLDDALSTLTTTETGDLLAPLTGTNLSTALGALTSRRSPRPPSPAPTARPSAGSGSPRGARA